MLVYVAGQLMLTRGHGLVAAYIFGISCMLFVQFDAVAEPEALAGLARTITTILLLHLLARFEDGDLSNCGALATGAGFFAGVAVASKPIALPVVAVSLFWIYRVVWRSGLR